MKNSFQEPLTETERFAYLQAMEVPLWIPRDLAGENTEQSANENGVSENAPQVETSTGVNLTAQTSLNNSQSFETKQQNQEPERDSSIDTLQQTNNDKSDIEVTSKSDDADSKETSPNKLSHFVKMVPWQSGTPSNDSLLIVCRHQVDQPAQSFARPSSPSQFMTDFIMALQSLRKEDDPCYVQIGHLSQAGLGKDCVPLGEVLANSKPKVTLVLGEETVTELFAQGANVADLRGKVMELVNGQACIVSYHPFTLIKNPQLKSLALEDLKMVKALLEQSQTIG